MKKLKLKALKFGAKEVLTRDQLRMVLGGFDDGSGSGSGKGSGSGSGTGTGCNCNSADDCSKEAPRCVNGCGGPKGNYYGVCAA